MSSQGFTPCRLADLPPIEREPPILPLMLRAMARELPAAIAIALLITAVIMWSA